MTPDEVDLVLADGAGVPVLDALELEALQRVFGGRTDPVPVTAPSSWTGRLMAGGSALDVATALLAMPAGIVPGTAFLDDRVDAPGVDLVQGSRVRELSTVVGLARGYGGFNSSLVLRRHRGFEEDGA